MPASSVPGVVTGPSPTATTAAAAETATATADALAETVLTTHALTDSELRRTPLEVTTNALTDDELRARPVPVDGPLTDEELRASPLSVTTDGLTDAQLRATAVPVSGPLTDAQLRATAVPVDGPLTDVQLRATPVPVSGTFSVTGGLSDIELRRTPLEVTTDGLTDDQLRARAVPVCGTVTAVPAADWVDATFKALRVSDRPIQALGFYGVSGTTGTYAGLAASTPLFSMRWGDATRFAIILKVTVSVFTTVAASAAGITERQLIIARSFTVSDTGGSAVTLTGNNQKRRTSMDTSRVTDMRFGAPLTAGTRTLDANPVATSLGWSGLLSTGLVIGGTGSSGVAAARSTEGGIEPVKLLDAINGQDYPIVLTQNEGIVVRIGVVQPTGSTQQTFLNIVWAEANAY